MRTRIALRQRLLQQFLLVVSLPLLLMGAVGALVLLPTLENAAEQRNERLASALRDEVEQVLVARLQAARLIADRLASGPVATAPLYLRSLLAADPLVQAAYITDADGVIREVALSEASRLNAADFAGLDQSSQPHYRAARAQGRAQWSETFLSILTGRLTVVLVLPAGPRTLMIELSLDELSNTLKDLGQPGGVHGVVLDRSGRVIADPRSDAARRQESLAHLALVAGAIAGSGNAAGAVQLDGEEYLAHILPVGLTGWHVLVAEPMSSVLAPLRSLSWVLAVSLVAAFITAIALAWWFARAAGREASLLTTAAQLPSEAPAVEPDFRTAEFGQLWERLNALFKQVGEREAQAQAARRDLQAVLDAATEVAIVATDVDGMVRLFSRGASKMLGYAPAEVIGRCTPLVWHDPHELAVRCDQLARELGRPVSGMEAFRAIPRDGGHEVRDWTFVRADGKRLDVSLAVTGIRNRDDQLTGFLGVATDITERRKAVVLETARRAAEAASHAKSEFLSRMSHELRSPLNAMLGFAQLMDMDADEPPSAGQRARLQQMQRAGWHLVDLIDDVLDLTRIEAGRTPIAIAPVAVDKVVGHAAELVAAEVERRGVLLVVHDVDTAGSVLADETRLTQVLVNLLSNAAKYNRPHGRIDVEWRPLDDGRLQISVRDSGLGMSARQLEHLFEPFNRLGREQGEVEGTGIGLVITRHLVQKMNGELRVDSREGQGSTFAVVLPRAGSAVADAPVSPVPAAPARAGAPRARVVYIEDNPLNVALMQQILRQRPHVELITASTVAAGLAHLRAATADLLLLDVHLPDGTGIDVLAALAADDTLRAVPVIMVTADATEHQRQLSLRHGARAYLTKPLDVVQTLMQIDRALAGSVA